MMLRRRMINAITIAISFMGEHFTSHNIIDFILSRPKYRKAYEDELMIMAKNDRRHAEQELNKRIGKYLIDNQKTLNIVFQRKEESENIHDSFSKIAHYEKQ